MRTLVVASVFVVVTATHGQCCPSTYLVSDVRMSWQEARDWAESVGGHLVCLASESEEAEVTQLVGPRAEYWIGYTDEASEGDWRWITGEPVFYTRWQSGEPNDTPSSESGEDYAMVWTFGGYGWWDYPSPWYYESLPVLAFGVAEFPPPAQPDRNGDGLVNGQDLAIVLGFWGECAAVTCLGDADFDGNVNGADLAIVLGGWTG